MIRSRDPIAPARSPVVRVAAVLLLSANLLVGPSSAAAPDDAEDKKVRATKANETAAVAGDGYLAWQEAAPDKPKQLDVYVKTSAGEIHKVNRRGTEGALGGIDGGRLVYQEFEGAVEKKGSDSTIRIYDLQTRDRLTIEEIDTKRWEYGPSISGDLVSFVRITKSSGSFDDRSLMLFNLVTGEKTVVAANIYEYYLQPGQLNGNWLTWVEWTNSSSTPSSVRVYDIANGRDHFVNYSGKFEWAPSVSFDGTVYMLTTGSKCGSNPKFSRFTYDPNSMSYPEEGHRVLKMRDGRDAAHSFVYVDEKGKLRMLHERLRCGNLASDVYEIVDSYKLSVSKDGSGSGTVTSSPEGISCGTDCTDVYAGGLEVTLVADPSLTSSFDGWTGACEDQSSTCTVTMNEALSTTATFTFGP